MRQYGVSLDDALGLGVENYDDDELGAVAQLNGSATSEL